VAPPRCSSSSRLPARDLHPSSALTSKTSCAVAPPDRAEAPDGLLLLELRAAWRFRTVHALICPIALEPAARQITSKATVAEHRDAYRRKGILLWGTRREQRLTLT
jgi:hypothetical protein